MILGIRKRNFIVYLVLLIFSILFLCLSIIFYSVNENLKCGDVFLSLFTSIAPTVFVSYFIDFCAEKRDDEKNKELRKSFLWGVPHGLMRIAKIIIEKYYVTNDCNTRTFKNCFDHTIEILESIDANKSNYRERKLLINKLQYGISLCLRDFDSIINKSIELEINNIFNKEELISIQLLFDECNQLLLSSCMSETIEHIKLLINTAVDVFPEIKIMLNRNVDIRKNRIFNRSQISK